MKLLSQILHNVCKYLTEAFNRVQRAVCILLNTVYIDTCNGNSFFAISTYLTAVLSSQSAIHLVSIVPVSFDIPRLFHV